jgi:signal transduction histidine kinase
MGPFLQQTFNLLTSATGSLTYQLVLAFAVMGALYASLNHWRGREFPQVRRVVIGLASLLGLRLALFLLAGIAWQGLFDSQALLPLIDRAVTLLSLVVIVWLWAFPEPLRMADAGLLLVGLLTITLAVLGGVWWSNQAAGQAFNGSYPDTLAEIYAIALIAIGALLLLVRRPDGWSYGLSMLGLLLLGHLGHLILSAPNGDYAGAVRLAQIAAYPLLLILPQRFPISETELPAVPSARKDGQPGLDPKILPAFLTLASDVSKEEICHAITGSVARFMLADLCLLVQPPDQAGKFFVECGYDLVHERYLPEKTYESQLTPVLSSALRHGRSLRLPASSTSPDLLGIARALDLPRAGDLLAAPMGSGQGVPHYALVLLTPYSGRGWGKDDQNYLTQLAEALVQLLQRRDRLAQLQQELEQARQTAEDLRSQRDQEQQERQALAAQVAALQQASRKDHSQLSSLVAMVNEQESLQDKLQRLQAENESLQQAARQATGARPEEIQHLEGELRLSLQEIALLKSSLSEAEEKMAALKVESTPASEGAPLTEEQVEGVANIAQELRQPMSSIIGYTDFLLAETLGILNAMQRKFLERVKVSTERMVRLVDDLIEAADMQGAQHRLAFSPVDLSQVIDEAVSTTRDQLRQKNIALRFDLEEELPSIDADQQALREILALLLQNAGSITPVNGGILLRTQVESSEGKQDYVLLQVADEGGGIPVEALPRVFSHLAANGENPIPGLGQTNPPMASVKTLVEALGGRIWVDSQAGQGATFSVLLPVSKNGNLVDDWEPPE